MYTLAFGQTYRTQPLSDDIYSIQVNADADWKKLPVIKLDNNQFIQINFDRIAEDAYNYLQYRIVHCNADWTRSSLSEIEYMDGFNNIRIEDYAASINTTVNYSNYIIQFPNDRVRLKLSGNYAVEVFDNSQPDAVLLTACFSVIDPQVMVGGTVSSVTDIDANREHQQVSFWINYNNLRVRDVFSDLKIYARQNNRLDNQKTGIKPTSIQGTKLVYEHNWDLIFEAGNEYRRFETVGHRYNGINVQSTQYIRPNYYAHIIPDKVRTGKTYGYDQDQNGRFLIRNAEAQDNDTEADYFITQFTLKADEPFLEPVYINGGFTYNSFDERYLMEYDFVEKEYTKSLLLKQGAYNYQYLAKRGNSYTTSLIEGNYYETENEYQILIYYRPLGSRSDLLVGSLLIGGK